MPAPDSSRSKVFFFETHPIQYRAPVFQALQQLIPDRFEVIYASDFSVRGYGDRDFSTQLAWDVPLLEGYRYRVMSNETERGIESFGGLTGKGVCQLIARERPAAVCLASLGYAFNWTAYLAASLRKIPVWLRVETQDQAFPRSRLKSRAREVAYRLAYAGVDHAFSIGQLNRDHLLRHGIPARRITSANYCTPDRFVNLSHQARLSKRMALREGLGIDPDHRVVAFFGKLIDKKQPTLLLAALERLAARGGAEKWTCLYVGAGALENDLRAMADTLQGRYGVRTVFSGFVNQSALPDYYLVSDIVVLPSKQMGETWGLVVNEALQAGCAVVVSEAVGCAADFGSWDRVRVIPVGGTAELSQALEQLAVIPRDFDWAKEKLADYTCKAAASSIAAQVLKNRIRST